MSVDSLSHNFLSRLNSLVKRRVTVVLIGGNALVFLGFKEATKDIDIVCRSVEPEVAKFCVEYMSRFKVKAEFFIDGLFKGIRIKDYLKQSYVIDQSEFPNIELKILNIYDIVLMKIDRSLPRDLEDVSEVARKGGINEKELDARFNYLLRFTMNSYREHFTYQYQTFKKQFGSIFKP